MRTTVLAIALSILGCDAPLATQAVTVVTSTQRTDARDASDGAPTVLGERIDWLRRAAVAPRLAQCESTAELEARLFEIWHADQTVRTGASGWSEGDLELAREIDRAHTAELKEFIATNGWPTLSVHGAEICEMCWLIAQHADGDREFQREVLSRMEALPTDEVIAANHAYLWDRIAVAENRLQRFGTQGGCSDDGVWAPKPYEDAADLDTRRSSAGLGPISEYVKEFRCALRE